MSSHVRGQRRGRLPGLLAVLALAVGLLASGQTLV